MAVLTVQKISQDGTAISTVAADAAGDQFYNDGKTFFTITNGGTASITVTINSQKKCNYGFDHDISVSIGAGSEIKLGSFQKERFDDSAGRVSVTYSDATSVSVAAVKL